MTVAEYLEAIKDLQQERDEALRPYQEALRTAIFQAEAEAEKVLHGPVKFEDKARRMPNQQTSELFLSYLYKWHEEDVTRALAAQIAKLEENYYSSVEPINAKYSEAVDERLKCFSKV